jgi:ATP-dependent RNA helicase SUPV3L1/SUV3
VKSLDQEARAALRRLGVRFGAYHVFLPALLKPGPAGLLTLLWALANDGKDRPGFGDVVNALATGRTSLAVDPTFEKEFYRLAGFRLLGRRAVRVDILERLADLIRPALSWRPGTGARPEGGYDGAAFVVTPAMMSILGATADDMEEILKGLGYRGEARPAGEVKSKLESLDQAARAAAEAEAARKKAAAEAAAAPAACTAAAALGDDSGAEPRSPGDVAAELADASAAVGISDEAAESADMPPAQAETAPAVEQIAEPAVETTIDQAPESTVAAEASPDATATPVVPDMRAEPVEEEKPIMLWRPGRFGDRQRQESRGRGRRGQPRESQPRESQQREGQPREGLPRDAQPGRERHPREGQPREGQPERPAGRPAEGREGGKGRFENRFRDKGDRPRGDRPDRGGPGGKPERDRGGKGDRNDRGDHRPAFQQKPREERPVKFDPDSPFAKLAALRDQLKK